MIPFLLYHNIINSNSLNNISLDFQLGSIQRYTDRWREKNNMRSIYYYYYFFYFYHDLIETFSPSWFFLLLSRFYQPKYLGEKKIYFFSLLRSQAGGTSNWEDSEMVPSLDFSSFFFNLYLPAITYGYQCNHVYTDAAGQLACSFLSRGKVCISCKTREPFYLFQNPEPIPLLFPQRAVVSAGNRHHSSSRDSISKSEQKDQRHSQEVIPQHKPQLLASHFQSAPPLVQLHAALLFHLLSHGWKIKKRHLTWHMMNSNNGVAFHFYLWPKPTLKISKAAAKWLGLQLNHPSWVTS